MVRELALTGGGVVPAALLNPFLAGGAGEGTLVAELDIAGPRDTARGELRLSGAGAGFFFASPYALEVGAPELVVRVDGGAATFEGGARLNEGRLSFSGEGDGENGVAGRAQLKGVQGASRLRPADRCSTAICGSTVAPDGEGLLAGRVTVDQGQLTRSLRLDSLLLDQLLPADLLGTELDPLEAIALDSDPGDAAGRAGQEQPGRPQGSVGAGRGARQPAQPIIEGRLEADPGGLVYAYGQTVRLDSAAVVYRGLPQEEPTLELQTTTSFEDPSIGRLAGNDPFAELRPKARTADEGKETRRPPWRRGPDHRPGLVSGRAVQRLGLGEVLGGARIGFRPPLIFGEADPGARLTASTDLSARATLAASIDLRNAERQTYLLDLHDEQAAAGSPPNCSPTTSATRAAHCSSGSSSAAGARRSRARGCDG